MSTETTTTTTTAGIALSDVAAQKVSSLLKQEGRDDLSLRVAVQPGGCSGLRYQLYFDDRALDGDTVTEFGADKPGTVYFDDSTDHLYELFQQQKGIYHVALVNNIIVGGGGINPTTGLAADTCELVKLYLSPEVRGKGIGKTLMERCLHAAKKAGYKKVLSQCRPRNFKATIAAQI